MRNATSTSAGFAPPMSVGTFESVWKLSPTKTPMIASGTRIETIVFGWRSRWLSESRSTASSSAGSSMDPTASAVTPSSAIGSPAGRG